MWISVATANSVAYYFISSDDLYDIKKIICFFSSSPASFSPSWFVAGKKTGKREAQGSSEGSKSSELKK